MNRIVVLLYVCVCAVGMATAQLRPTNEELGSIYFAYPTPVVVQTPPPLHLALRATWFPLAYR